MKKMVEMLLRNIDMSDINPGGLALLVEDSPNPERAVRFLLEGVRIPKFNSEVVSKDGYECFAPVHQLWTDEIKFKVRVPSNSCFFKFDNEEHMARVKEHFGEDFTFENRTEIQKYIKKTAGDKWVGSETRCSVYSTEFIEKTRFCTLREWNNATFNVM